jgi:hypothetical protein
MNLLKNKFLSKFYNTKINIINLHNNTKKYIYKKIKYKKNDFKYYTKISLLEELGTRLFELNDCTE